MCHVTTFASRQSYCCRKVNSQNGYRVTSLLPRQNTLLVRSTVTPSKLVLRLRLYVASRELIKSNSHDGYWSASLLPQENVYTISLRQLLIRISGSLPAASGIS